MRALLALLALLLTAGSAHATCCAATGSTCATPATSCVTPVPADTPCPNATWSVECTDSSCIAVTRTATATATATGTATATATATHTATATATATNTATPVDTATATATATHTPAGQAPASWDGSMLQFLRFESANINADSGTSGGTHPDLPTTTGTVTADTTNYVDGTQSVVVASGSNYKSCAIGTCTQVDIGTSYAGSWGCFVRSTSSTTQGVYGTGNTGGTGGWGLRLPNWDGSNYYFQCVVNGTFKDNGGALSLNTWRLLGCNLTSEDALTTWINGVQIGSATASVTGPSSNDTLRVGRMGSENLIGSTDACFLTASGTVLSASQWCRIYACGVAGDRCYCDGATPANYKACSTDADCAGRANACDAGTGKCTGRLSGGPTTCNDTGELSACDAAAP